MELSVSLEELCRIVLRLREYEAQVPAVDPDDGSNPTDDKDVSVLEDESNESVEQELIAAIGDLAEDEAVEMIALSDRKSTRPNSSDTCATRMPSSDRNK